MRLMPMSSSIRLVVASWWLWIMLAAVSLHVAAPLSGQQIVAPESRAQVVVHVGLGGRAGNDASGPHLVGGGGLEVRMTSTLSVAGAASGWVLPMACTPSGDPEADRERCASSGWRADAGVNLLLRRTEERFRPYAGGGLGALRIADTHLAANARTGINVQTRGSVGVRLELRYDRAFGATEPNFWVASAGVRLPFLQ
jgi:hypothetical protein